MGIITLLRNLSFRVDLNLQAEGANLSFIHESKSKCGLT